ncbi:hypothetical protein LDENG_00213420 [Lucifuga dentata]|nr:hypothetical protein LDENG_00213420 [Lucifuga dentata]
MPNLGVKRSSLSLDAHLRQLTCSSFFCLRNIEKLRAVVSKTELELAIHAFISSCLDYCNSLLTCLSKTALNQLQTVQNVAARLSTKSLAWSGTPYLVDLIQTDSTSRSLRSSGQKLLVVLVPI